MINIWSLLVISCFKDKVWDFSLFYYKKVLTDLTYKGSIAFKNNYCGLCECKCLKDVMVVTREVKVTVNPLPKTKLQHWVKACFYNRSKNGTWGSLPNVTWQIIWEFRTINRKRSITSELHHLREDVTCVYGSQSVTLYMFVFPQFLLGATQLTSDEWSLNSSWGFMGLLEYMCSSK